MLGIIKRVYITVVGAFVLMGVWCGVYGLIYPTINVDARLLLFNSLITGPVCAWLFYKLVVWIFTGKFNSRENTNV